MTPQGTNVGLWLPWIAVGVAEVIVGLIASWTILWVIGAASMVTGVTFMIRDRRRTTREHDAEAPA